MSPLFCNSGEQQRVRQSTKFHARAKLSDEEFSAIEEANEPLIVLLEYTFACNAAFLHDSIDARFGGVRLPTTIKEAQVVITYLCNLVTVQIHSALVSFGIVAHFSVSTFPVAVNSNGVEHLAFDLTHVWRWLFELRLVWQQMGGNGENDGHSPNCHTPKNSSNSSAIRSQIHSLAGTSNTAHTQSMQSLRSVRLEPMYSRKAGAMSRSN